MKHFKAIALAVAVISSSAVNATAADLQFKAPDIRGKLNNLVEAKMDKLAKDTYLHRGYTQIVELRQDGSAYIPAVMNERIDHDVKANRS